MRSLACIFLITASTALFSSHSDSELLEQRRVFSKPYGSFFTTFFTPVDTKNPIVPFDETALGSGLMSLTPRGGILLKEQGAYQVTFGASIAYMINPEDPDNLQLGIYIDGVFQKGTNFTIPPTSINIMNSLSCIVKTTAPSQELVLQYRNYTSGSLFSLGSSMPGDVTAYITILKL